MVDDTRDLLSAAQSSLNHGMRLSKQGTYARRAPDPKSLSHFADARSAIERVLAEAPDDREALLMMSQVLECLLDYSNSLGFLNRAFDAGEPRTKRLLKRWALLRENCKTWRDLGLSPELLRQLGDYLDAQGVDVTNSTLELTRQWLIDNNIGEPEAVVQALGRRGAYSDFQVLANVVRG